MVFHKREGKEKKLKFKSDNEHKVNFQSSEYFVHNQGERLTRFQYIPSCIMYKRQSQKILLIFNPSDTCFGNRMLFKLKFLFWLCAAAYYGKSCRIQYDFKAAFSIGNMFRLSI